MTAGDRGGGGGHEDITEMYLPAPGLDSLAAALAAFQADLPAVGKTRTADTGTYSYRYADLADMSEVVLPALARYGLAFAAVPHGHELHGMLLHTSGQSLTGSLPIGGSSPQAIGSAITYARRYLLSALTGVAADDDDDGQAATKQTTVDPWHTSPADEPASVAVGNTSRPATPEQLRYLGVLFGQMGVRDRTERLNHVRVITGRPELASSTELTMGEASDLITELKAEAPAEPVEGS